MLFNIPVQNFSQNMRQVLIISFHSAFKNQRLAIIFHNTHNSLIQNGGQVNGHDESSKRLAEKMENLSAHETDESANHLYKEKVSCLDLSEFHIVFSYYLNIIIIFH